MFYFIFRICRKRNNQHGQNTVDNHPLLTRIDRFAPVIATVKKSPPCGYSGNTFLWRPDVTPG
jgi:hypothetical protein